MKAVSKSTSVAFVLSLSCVLPFASFALPQVSETLKLSEGWNAVYIESTPTNSLCEDFFRDTSVVAAAAYRSDADSSTAQYDASGEEKVQAPISFLQWSRGETTSALKSIVGGNTFLLFATTFLKPY